MELMEHETASQGRYEKLKHAIEGAKMSETRNIFEGGGAGLGAGLGGGLLGGILGGALLGNRGLLGGGGVVEPCVTPMQLQTATGSIIDSGQNTAVMGQLSNISAAIPLAEAQVQLALAQTQAAVSNQIGQTENLIVGGQAVINKGISDAIAASLASQSALNVNILTQGSATRDAVNAMGVANLTATANSTKEILAAINETNMANLQRQLAVAESALLETRAEGRARGTEVNVTQTVNQNQMQMQAQAQQQQQAILLNTLCNHVVGLQNAVATNSNMIIGNTGAVGTGPQTANPVNVRT